MQKPRLYILVMAIVVVPAVLLVALHRERDPAEPEYGGRKLSQWVLELPSKSAPGGETAAEMALRHIGTSALPYLLKWISYEPAPWRLKLYENAGRFLKRSPNSLFEDKRMLRAAGAARAFGVLGADADPAKEELRRLLRDRKIGLSRLYAFLALNSEDIRMHIDRWGKCTVTTHSGVDGFSLTYKTNGAPVLTISHTNVPLPPPMLRKMPTVPNPSLKAGATNVVQRIDLQALERAAP